MGVHKSPDAQAGASVQGCITTEHQRIPPCSRAMSGASLQSLKAIFFLFLFHILLLVSVVRSEAEPGRWTEVIGMMRIGLRLAAAVQRTSERE